MLGKRFHRTTSMAQIGPACSIKPHAAPLELQDSDYQPITQWEILKQAEELMKKMMAAAASGGHALAGTDPGRPAGTGSSSSSSSSGDGSSTIADTALPLRSPPDFIPRGTFLDTCFFCKRRLKHERDIFIYRGDAAFCTEECRQRHILNGESSMTASNKKGGPSSEAAVAA